MAEPSKAPPLASILPHLPHLEATPASELPPEPPPPIPHSGDADEEIPLFALGVPPDFTVAYRAHTLRGGLAQYRGARTRARRSLAQIA